MAWEERTVEQMREEFVRRVLAQEQSKTALCREYGISRPTGDKWIERFQTGQSMSDQSRAPKTIPGRIPAELEDKIVQLRKQYPAIGAVKLRRMMEDAGHTDLPCARTFNNIFRRHDLIGQEESAAATPIQRFEKAVPNEMWQADFKGHFRMKNGYRCHPLNILDDCSRFNLCIEALENETYDAVKPVMERLFREYGLPFSFLCDNGNPWGTAQSLGYSKFEVWLMELGILTLHGRPRHPQTQGKEERFNRSFTRECLKGKEFKDKAHAQSYFDEYRIFYNEVRPHFALDLEVPATHYQSSKKQFPNKIEVWEYESEYKLCKVKETGYFNYDGQGFFLSEAFGGKTIAVRESHLPGQLTLVFRNFIIGRIDLNNRVYTLKRAYLIEGDPRANV
jgi:transposase InsO family protein